MLKAHEKQQITMLSKFLDPKNDIAFRRIFGSERNKDILIHFINDILVFKEATPIVDVTLPSRVYRLKYQKKLAQKI